MSYLVYQIIKAIEDMFVYDSKQLKMSGLDGIIDDLSPYDHNQYKVLEHIKEVVLARTVMLRQTDLCQVS